MMGEEGLIEKRLGPVILKVRSATVNLHDIVPNPEQPRMGPKEDAELRKNILENGGLFEPILVEPHPTYEGKYQIIDGEKRWTNCKILVEVDKRDQFKKLPVQISDRTLSPEERLRSWVIIHMQREDWSLKEKERTAYRLTQLVDRVRAANYLGITVRELDKLVKIFELSERMTSIPNPDSSITYAREIMALPQYIRGEAENALVKKVNEGLITSSKQIRDVRKIWRDDSAKEVLLRDTSTVQDALNVLEEPTETGLGENFVKDLDILKSTLTAYPWPQLLELKGKPEALQKVKECRQILSTIEKAIS
jgi:ParB family chromosome partitioning protein